MRDHILQLGPGLALCALVLVAAVFRDVPKDVLLVLGALFVIACGAGLVLTRGDADAGQEPCKHHGA
jgi:hypothetical protein